MSAWVDVAAVEDLPAGTGREAIVGDSVVALFRTDEGVFALDGLCAHQGGPLAEGRLDGCVVTCPWHGWQFDVRTGVQQASGRTCQRRFAVRVEAARVSVASKAQDELRG